MDSCLTDTVEKVLLSQTTKTVQLDGRDCCEHIVFLWSDVLHDHLTFCCAPELERFLVPLSASAFEPGSFKRTWNCAVCAHLPEDAKAADIFNWPITHIWAAMTCSTRASEFNFTVALFQRDRSLRNCLLLSKHSIWKASYFEVHCVAVQRRA